jgi:hypothetical protein
VSELPRLINAADIAATVLPFEDVPCPPLGGAVRVRALDLTQRLTMESRIGKLKVKNADNPDAALFTAIPEVLAICVVDIKGNPVFTATRWAHFGSVHGTLALELFNKAWTLSGLSGSDAKKN